MNKKDERSELHGLVAHPRSAEHSEFSDASVAYEVAKTMQFNFIYQGRERAALVMSEVREFLQRFAK